MALRAGDDCPNCGHGEMLDVSSFGGIVKLICNVCPYKYEFDPKKDLPKDKQ
jgi:uncharacterized protein (DUF983 family)